MSKPNAKHVNESGLLLKLQNKHGYMLHDVPKSQRATMVFGPDPKRAGKTTITACRVIQLVVPMDSALAAAMNRHSGPTEPRKRKAVAK